MNQYAEGAQVTFRMHERSSNVEDDFFVVEITDGVNGDRLMEIKFDAAELMRAVVGMSSASGTALIRRENKNLNKRIIAVQFGCEAVGIARFDKDAEEKLKEFTAVFATVFGFDNHWVSKSNAGPRATLQKYVEPDSLAEKNAREFKEEVEKSNDLRALVRRALNG